MNQLKRIKGCTHDQIWTVAVHGSHPSVEDTTVKSYGISCQIIDLVLVLTENNPDAKAKDILVSLTVKRKAVK